MGLQDLILIPDSSHSASCKDIAFCTVIQQNPCSDHQASSAATVNFSNSGGEPWYYYLPTDRPKTHACSYVTLTSQELQSIHYTSLLSYHISCRMFNENK
ncbi:hypothetical protein TNCV_1446411 [Trichonephila clavipes]|nr:hypothetical protein TNCV_1446411 [Trichonephila clavipes]